MTKPEDYKLIATLWYSTIENEQPNANVINFNTTPETVAVSNIRSLYSSPYDPLGFGPLGNEFNISYQITRIPTNNPNSAITKPSQNETFVVNVPSGSFNATAVYFDNGSSTTTNAEKEVFMVNGGTGIFGDAKIAIIKYDNTGEIFGYPFSRRVEVFKL